MPRTQRETPTAARSWGLRCHTTTTRTERETGRKYKAHTTRDVLGEPGDDGEVANRWPAAEFSPRVVLERWGAGRYTVDWFDKAGKKCGEHKFTVDEPSAPARGAAAAAEADEDADVGAMALRLPKTQIEWMMWQQREERAADRRRREEMREERDRMRAEADERAARDREFLASITANLAGRESAAAAAPPGAMTADVLTRELAMMRRELLISQREQAIAIRAQILSELPDEPDGAENFAEAFNASGVAAVEAVGEQVPEVIGGLLGKLRAYLQLNGQPATPGDMAKLIEAARVAVAAQAAAEANGAGN